MQARMMGLHSGKPNAARSFDARHAGRKEHCMTKAEAMLALRTMSAGTIAGIIGSAKYERIDAAWCDWILAADAADDDAFQRCESVWDVVNTVTPA